MEGLLLSMMACFSADVVSILRKKRKTVTSYQLSAQAERAEDFPKVFTTIQLHLLVQSPDSQPADVERSIELARTKYCSAMAMFDGQAVPFHIYL
jgi:putative redox protein